ncbi:MULTISPECIES: tRNA pseudouridine(13) synthase TruD [unclassified Lysobacter]|uniref:tRNA pseudouridine(13) synthase TruD n=1 Tax=unclassified Lysobacter TaxID=2635362 RepID=UPI0007000D4D|nr:MULTISPECIES: tRNA pseudouridine(13) synthase TruD [unclassified Lysobacter]KQZ66134.1 pseudouridine synthase [Lysobacter sp. Root559]KRC32162.1 pseudouridine synthase [Lysobacter sp. Root76]KRD67624.1 pseudouridine synthase [Lysobacter sp. Root96]
MSAEPGLARAHGAPALRARIRSVAEDFQVEELPGFEPSGSGEHLLLTIEKRGMNTAFAAKRIAAWAGVGELAIGYAGLKDRHALTRQRFSVHLPKRVAPDLAALQEASASGEGLRVLDSAWHAKKLPRGALAGNRFVLTLRELEGDRAAIEARLQALAARGVPNYFGEQRFGRDGDNVANALAMFGGRRVRREQRSLLLSAARSELFNRVLAARVNADCWDRPLDGEVWMLDGSRSVFGPEPFDDTLAARLAAFDIHPSGPLWGRGELRSRDAAAAIEQAALDGEDAAALRAGLEQAGLNQERRALRLRPAGLSWRWIEAAEGAALELDFVLPAGAYATVVLAELGDIATFVRP